MAKPLLPDAIRYSTAAATIAATTWVMMYAATSFHGNRFAVAKPTVTAGLKWPPEMWPTAYAIVSTVNPKARETPTNPIPS